MTLAAVVVTPLVQIKFPNETAPRSFSLAELLSVEAGETLEVALAWSDAQLKQHIANHLDCSPTSLNDLVVTRPQADTGNILVSKPAEYGV